MQTILRIRQIYDEYLSDTARLQAALKPTDGLLGFGTRPDSDPCHDRFIERLDEILTSLAAGQPSSQEVREVLDYMYGEPEAYKKNQMVYLMLLAVHGITEKVVGFLTPEDAAGLSASYAAAYPKHTLLPVQKKLLGKLRQAAGTGAARKKSLLDRLLGRS